MKYVVYDIEIIKAPPPYEGPLLDGIDYCAGWSDHKNMGVSVIGCYDSSSDRWRVFCEDNFADFHELIMSTDLAVGFNNISFDDKVLSYALGSSFSVLKPERYDLLKEIWVAAGLEPEWRAAKTHGGYGLDAVCEATLLEKKTGHGAVAPVNWQRGNIGSVVDYCLQDVRLTKRLFELVLSDSPIINPKTKEPLRIRRP